MLGLLALGLARRVAEGRQPTAGDQAQQYIEQHARRPDAVAEGERSPSERSATRERVQPDSPTDEEIPDEHMRPLLGHKVAHLEEPHHAVQLVLSRIKDVSKDKNWLGASGSRCREEDHGEMNERQADELRDIERTESERGVGLKTGEFNVRICCSRE